jgi:hypothetical protein
MSTGQAPSLMLDLANSQIRDRQRHARERADRDTVRRTRLVPALAARAR